MVCCGREFIHRSIAPSSSFVRIVSINNSLLAITYHISLKFAGYESNFLCTSSRTPNLIMKLSTFFAVMYLVVSFSSAQEDYYNEGGGDYNDYGEYGEYGQQDNLYQNYAERQQNKGLVSPIK
jgi:hypothetical protein